VAMKVGLLHLQKKKILRFLQKFDPKMATAALIDECVLVNCIFWSFC